jgi:hypothetical protein
METYVINPKWYDSTSRRGPPSQDRWVVKRFMNVKKLMVIQKRGLRYILSLSNDIYE